MRILSILIAFASLLAGISATLQKPLHEQDSTSHQSAPSSWNLNFSSSAPHYFASVYGVLQEWPNTFFPHGHSIVPCEIPPLTNLYHGRRDDAEAPPSPEWFAFDIGMAYGIMGGSRESFMHTYQTKRRVKCIYFDGESATLFGAGQMDTQMLHIYGNTSGPAGRGGFGLWEEYARATGLCKWLDEAGLGGPGGYEGIVRMNAGFEMIWCDFTSPSIRLISRLNVTAPLLEPPEDDSQTQSNNLKPSYVPLPPSPTRTEKSTDPSDPPFPPVRGGKCLTLEPFWNTQAWNWFVAGTAHYGSSGEGAGRGENRVKISHSCGVLSYYSPKFLQPADKALNFTDDGRWLGPGKDNSGKKDRIIALESLTRRRRQHSLHSVTPEEAAIMREDSERVLRSLISSDSDVCSGIDWVLLANEIVQNYASALLVFKRTLSEFEEVSRNKTALQQWMALVRDKSHTFLLPFLEYPSDNKKEIWERGSQLYNDTYSRCKYQSTRLLAPEIGVPLSEEEQVLKWAVEETTGAICSVLVETGLQIESIWQSDFNTLTPTSTGQDIEPKASRWTQGVEELMAWLGWAGEWTRCEEKCGWDEKCFIPMWPMIPVGRRPQPGCRTGYGDHHPHGPPYGRPHDRPPYFGPPSNRTGRPPGGDFGWGQDETNLWDPICVKSDYILHG